MLQSIRVVLLLLLEGLNKPLAQTARSALIFISLNIMLIPSVHSTEATGYPDVFDDLATQGEDIFFNETFNGNGRTCGTCHRATENFTLTTDFIASLPADDPLFVAENVPALKFGDPANLDANGNPQRFENPNLMRAFGLIIENQDSMEYLQSRFNMRGVPHISGMSATIDAPLQELTPPEERVGWSGDGAPSGVIGGITTSGRLDDFMVGAIVQHFPRSVNRSLAGPNPDFRLPTAQEIDAMEAFLLSVGRHNELELHDGFPNELVLKDAGAEAGKVLFRDGVSGGTARCGACHSNAGANVDSGSNPGNRNYNIGVEQFLQNRLNDPEFTVVGEPRPVDGGFGTNPDGDFSSLVEQPGYVNENFGDMTFNTPSLIEAADTPPFFHNNAAATIEDAIRFFNSPEFFAGTGRNIPFNDTQVTQVANFLRVINAIDNIENSVLRQSDRALTALNHSPLPEDVVERLLHIMIADTDDAIEVLNQGNLYNRGSLPKNAVKQLHHAKKSINWAMNNHAPVHLRIDHINAAKVYLANAVNLMKY